MKISLCILTRNEADCLTKTLKPLAQYLKNNNLFDRVTVIDGNSTDGTVEMFQKHDIEVLNQIGRGRGAAFHTAFKLLDSDAWIFYSPDGNEDIEDLPKFIEALGNNHDIVIASRMMKDDLMKKTFTIGNLVNGRTTFSILQQIYFFEVKVVLLLIQ